MFFVWLFESYATAKAREETEDRETRPRLLFFFLAAAKRTFLYARCNVSSMFGGWPAVIALEQGIFLLCGAESHPPGGPSRARHLHVSKFFYIELDSSRLSSSLLVTGSNLYARRVRVQVTHQSFDMDTQKMLFLFAANTFANCTQTHF